MSIPVLSSRPVNLAAVLVALTVLLGCVTTGSPPQRRGIPLGRGPSDPESSALKPNNLASPGAPVAMPDGPVASPVGKESTTASRVTVSLMELGSVSFDGQVLPLLSPDGRFMAVESGEAPPWATLLATREQRPALGTRILAYSIDESSSIEKAPGQTPVLSPLSWALQAEKVGGGGGGLPAGILLGRSCDSSGFLIEAPQADGSRWIGRVAWLSGALTWLVNDQQVNAHAVLGPGGELAYSRRAIGAPLWELVIRRPGEQAEVVQRTPEVSYCQPLFSDELDVVYAFALSAGGVELFAYRLPATGGERELTVVGRRQILTTPDEAAVFQSVAGLQVPPVYPGQSLAKPTGGSGVLLLFHPGAGRMCSFDRRTGAMTPLLERSFAGVPVESDGREGYLLATEKSLRYLPWRVGGQTTGSEAQASEGLTVVSGALLPRLTTNLQWPYVLIGQGGKAGEARFKVMKLRLGEVR